jgi:hypothetical protein
MKNIQFKVKLLSDVILNQKSASQGNQQTLDFIPGSNFLGIVAAHYDDFRESEQLTVFHSSKVRFGDAHPVVGNKRALRTPASFQSPKSKDDNLRYVHHAIKEIDALKDLQLKQSREDFYIFEKGLALKIAPLKSFAIKSAYDKEKRRSKDEQMYGYQSIQEGTEFCFEICYDDDVDFDLVERIKSKLLGKKRIGRSRTAQYGLIEIQVEAFEKETSNFVTLKDIVIYAESRLVFLDEYLNPTLAPKSEDFGVVGGEIDWSKSQVRTFAYSPYNYHRACFDAERKGVEKGSVFVIKGGQLTENKEFIGFHQNEGFGKIIINPSFFACDEEGISKFVFKELDQSSPKITKVSELKTDYDKKLLNFLNNSKARKEAERTVYEKVNKFVENNKDKFKQEAFASQWGTIRNLAMQYPQKTDLERELFSKTTNRNGKVIPNAYLTHGVAKEKWSERERFKAFKAFFDDKEISDKMIQFAIINLSAEMAKIYGRKKA